MREDSGRSYVCVYSPPGGNKEARRGGGGGRERAIAGGKRAVGEGLGASGPVRGGEGDNQFSRSRLWNRLYINCPK